MAVRLKSRWHRSKRSERNRRGSSAPKTLLDLVSVIGINMWKLARETFLRMEKEGFRFREDTQAIDFIAEFLIFQLHIADRMLYGKVTDEQRATFINGLAKHLGDSLADNQADLLGENADYQQAFIQRSNARMADYAEFNFGEEGPSYSAIRFLGHTIAEILSITDDKWVVEQVIDIEAPELIQRIMPVLDQVLGLSRVEDKNASTS